MTLSSNWFLFACIAGVLLVLNIVSPTTTHSTTTVTEPSGQLISTPSFVSETNVDLSPDTDVQFYSSNLTTDPGLAETPVDSLSSVDNFTSDLRLDQPSFIEDTSPSSSESLDLIDLSYTITETTLNDEADPNVGVEILQVSTPSSSLNEWITNGTTIATTLEMEPPHTDVDITERPNVTESSTTLVNNYTPSMEVPTSAGPSLTGTTSDPLNTTISTLVTTNGSQEEQGVLTEIAEPKTSSENVDVTMKSEITTNEPLFTTEMLLPETTLEDSEMSFVSENAVISIWYVLIIQGNCSLIPLSEQEVLGRHFETLVTTSTATWLGIAKEDISVTAVDCGTSEHRIHVNLTITQRADSNITAQMSALEESKNPFLSMYGQSYYVYQIMTVNGFLNKDIEIPTDLRHSDVELLIYITVGSVCTFMLVLALGLLACKYCDCKEPKPFEFGDPPNLNMRLEDYTLTQIPRPKLGYTDYCRGLSKHYSPLDDQTVTSPNGMVQPFDTSVVPLEDARVLDAGSAPFREYHDGIIVRPLEIPRLGGSLGRMCYRSRSGTDSHFYYTVDADGFYQRSTENLNATYPNERYVDKGVDNPNFQ